MLNFEILATATDNFCCVETERMFSDVAAPSALYMTINPQYTIAKARELYGGEPRPLSGASYKKSTSDWWGSVTFTICVLLLLFIIWCGAVLPF